MTWKQSGDRIPYNQDVYDILSNTCILPRVEEDYYIVGSMNIECCSCYALHFALGLTITHEESIRAISMIPIAVDLIPKMQNQTYI